MNAFIQMVQRRFSREFGASRAALRPRARFDGQRGDDLCLDGVVEGFIPIVAYE